MHIIYYMKGTYHNITGILPCDTVYTLLCYDNCTALN